MRTKVNKWFIAIRDLEGILEEGRIYKIEEESENHYYLWGDAEMGRGIGKNYFRYIERKPAEEYRQKEEYEEMMEKLRV